MLLFTDRISSGKTVFYVDSNQWRAPKFCQGGERDPLLGDK